MLNVGGGEFLVILLVGLIVLGPQKLPEAARQIGRVMTELRKISSGFQQELRDALDEPVEDEARSRGEKAVASHNRAAENVSRAAAAVAKLDETESGPDGRAGAGDDAAASVPVAATGSDESSDEPEPGESEPEPEEPWRASPAAAAGMYDIADPEPSDGQPEVSG